MVLGTLLNDFTYGKAHLYGEDDLNLMMKYYGVKTIGEAVSEFLSQYDNWVFKVEMFAKDVISEQLPWQTLNICMNYCQSQEDYESCTMLKRAIKYWESFGDNDGEFDN
jgi:hypothetical protein